MLHRSFLSLYERVGRSTAVIRLRAAGLCGLGWGISREEIDELSDVIGLGAILRHGGAPPPVQSARGEWAGDKRARRNQRLHRPSRDDAHAESRLHQFRDGSVSCTSSMRPGLSTRRQQHLVQNAILFLRRVHEQRFPAHVGELDVRPARERVRRAGDDDELVVEHRRDRETTIAHRRSDVDVLTVIIRTSQASPSAHSGVALGAVEFASDGTPGREIIVFLDRLIRLVERTRRADLPVSEWPRTARERMIGRAMGRIIAHEIGHVVLRSKRHARSGLMSAAFAATT